MGKMFLVFLMLWGTVFAQRQGVPSTFSVLTFAVDEYENGWQHIFPGGVLGAEKLSETMKKNINKLYPSVDYSENHYKNDGVRKSVFISDATENYNFLYYHGHGAPNNITMWDYNGEVWNTEKKFGKRGTYWVMFVSCSVFQNGYSDQDPWFDGVHSILGFASIVWGGAQVRSCGWFDLKTCYQYSYEMEEEFAERWIKDKETIWSAFKNAVYNQLYDFGDKYKRKWYTKGIVPKIVYRYGDINGKPFEPWQEKFENVYQGPIFRTGYKGIASRWSVIGEPAYDEP